MNASLRRFFSLALVFVATFLVVTGLRIWHSGDGLPWLESSKREMARDGFTLEGRAALQLGDVELLARLNHEYAKLTRAVVPSVVSIDTAGVRTEQLRDFWGRARVRQYPTSGQGSGVIVTKEGHVVTNHHVVDGQQQIRVTLHGGKSHSATLVGKDTLLDIAVLKIDSDGPFTPLKLGDSSEVEVGQMVFAVGNPFGLGETVTQGIISAKERSLSDNQRDLFQTDAAINPGNSGGPLVNLRGEIIGINVAIFSSDKENPGFMGVGFSIPANDVRDTLFQILERGRPSRGYLGVQMHDLDASVRSALRYAGDHGAVVLSVLPGSPALEAGLRPWDVVQSYNGAIIHSTEQFLSLVQRTRVGTAVKMRIWRSGEQMELQATLIESEDGARAARDAGDEGTSQLGDPASVIDAMGVLVRNLDPRERHRGLRGIFVSRVDPAKSAARHLVRGDLILAVNNVRVESANEFFIHLASSAASRETSIHLIRNGQPVHVLLPPVGRAGE
ncbi:MAG: trypsin-like peptidase domain-containing protein [Luteolibacter sp.]